MPAHPLHYFLGFPFFCRNKLFNLACCQRFAQGPSSDSVNISPLSQLLTVVCSSGCAISRLFVCFKFFVERHLLQDPGEPALYFKVSTHFLFLGLGFLDLCQRLRSWPGFEVCCCYGYLQAPQPFNPCKDSACGLSKLARGFPQCLLWAQVWAHPRGTALSLAALPTRMLLNTSTCQCGCGGRKGNLLQCSDEASVVGGWALQPGVQVWTSRGSRLSSGCNVASKRVQNPACLRPTGAGPHGTCGSWLRMRS